MTDLEQAELERDRMVAHLAGCRAEIEHAMAAEKLAFKAWYAAEQKVTRLKVEEDLKNRDRGGR